MALRSLSVEIPRLDAREVRVSGLAREMIQVFHYELEMLPVLHGHYVQLVDDENFD